LLAMRSPGSSGRKLMRLSSGGSSIHNGSAQSTSAPQDGLLFRDRSYESSEDEDRRLPRRARSCLDMQRLSSDGTQRNSCLAIQEFHRLNSTGRRGRSENHTEVEDCQRGSSAALELLCSMDEDELDCFVRTPSCDLQPVSEDGPF
jgi:hypothetical protein